MEGEHTLGLTTFPVESIYKTEINENVSMYNSLPVIDEYQDVKRFFERPRLISSGTLSASRGNLSYLEVSEPVSQYWPGAAINRLNGVFGYRCSLKFTVTVASTPFQQGLVDNLTFKGLRKEVGVQYSTNNVLYNTNMFVQVGYSFSMRFTTNFGVKIPLTYEKRTLSEVIYDY